MITVGSIAEAIFLPDSSRESNRSTSEIEENILCGSCSFRNAEWRRSAFSSAFSASGQPISRRILLQQEFTLNHVRIPLIAAGHLDTLFQQKDRPAIAVLKHLCPCVFAQGMWKFVSKSQCNQQCLAGRAAMISDNGPSRAASQRRTCSQGSLGVRWLSMQTAATCRYWKCLRCEPPEFPASRA